MGCRVGSFARTSIKVRDCGVSDAYTDVKSDVSLVIAVFTAFARSSSVGTSGAVNSYRAWAMAVTLYVWASAMAIMSSVIFRGQCAPDSLVSAAKWLENSSGSINGRSRVVAPRENARYGDSNMSRNSFRRDPMNR